MKTVGLSRVQRSVSRRGLAGTARLAVLRVAQQAYLRERHVWYALDLGAERARRELADGLELVRGDADRLALLAGLPTIPAHEALRRLAEGVEWWLVLEADRPAFSCWIFRRSVPVLAAPGGRLALPDGMAFLEDSVTSPAFRGRSVAPAAWSRVADTLAAGGVRTLLTKVERDNAPVRRALEKAGFAVVASVELERVGRLRRVAVEADATPGGRIAATLAR